MFPHGRWVALRMRLSLWRRVALGREQCFRGKMLLRELDVITPRCVFIGNIVFPCGGECCVFPKRYRMKKTLKMGLQPKK